MLPAGQPHSFEHREAEWATPLCYAIVGGNLKIVERLISQGATIEPHSGRFLDYAMAYGRVEIVKALLENGADPSEAPRYLGRQFRNEQAPQELWGTTEGHR